MSNQPRMLNNDETPDSAVRVRGERRFMSDSGVYAKLAQAIASFGKEEWDECDDDEAVTLVRLPAPQRHNTNVEADLAERFDADELTAPLYDGRTAPLLSRLPLGRDDSRRANAGRTAAQLSTALVRASVPTPAAAAECPVLIDAELEEDQSSAQSARPQPSAPGYDVALELNGEELARIWARERTALAGRAYVWSEQADSWTLMHDAHEALASVQPYIEQSMMGAPSAVRSRESLAAKVLQPASWFLAGASVAAAFLVAFGLARSAGQSSGPAAEVTLNDVVVSAGATQRSSEPPASVSTEPKSATSAAHTASTEIIPVSALPLVSDSERSHGPKVLPIIAVSALPLGEAQSAVRSSHSARSSQVNATATGLTFDTARARQALSYASRLMQRCTGASELSGSAVVTFDPSGAVNDVAVQSIMGDVSKMSCVVSAFHAVRVPAFTGTAVSVKKSFGAGA